MHSIFGSCGAFPRLLCSNSKFSIFNRKLASDVGAPSDLLLKKVLDKPSPRERRAKRHQITRIKRTKYPILNSRLKKYFQSARIITPCKPNKTIQVLELLKSNELLTIHDDEEEDHVEALKETKEVALFHDIFPNLLSNFSPKIYLDVRFAGPKRVFRGNLLLPTETFEFPSVKFDAPRQDDIFTFMMVDLDSPLKQEHKQHFCNYAVMNVMGSDIASGKVVVEWLPGLPEANTGLHRYCFLLLKQSRQLDQFETFKSLAKNSDTLNRYFNLHELVKNNDLKPMGLSFYRSTHDESVSEFMKKREIPEIKYDMKYFQKKKKIVQVQYNQL